LLFREKLKLRGTPFSLSISFRMMSWRHYCNTVRLFHAISPARLPGVTQRFFQGDFVSATYILTPLLENSLRHVLKSNGHDLTIFDATRTQQDRTISSLFERTELDSILTPAITADIERVFLTKPGLYLRHALAHGLLHDGDPYSADAIYACWLILRLCLLPLFQHREWLRSMFSGTELCRV
jgi:hypothetical protein